MRRLAANLDYVDKPANDRDAQPADSPIEENRGGGARASGTRGEENAQ
jgi:hypothetical protein